MSSSDSNLRGLVHAELCIDEQQVRHRLRVPEGVIQRDETAMGKATHEEHGQERAEGVAHQRSRARQLDGIGSPQK